MKTKKCQFCNTLYRKTHESLEAWENRKYCSIDCYRKVPRSQEVRKRISETNKKVGVGQWMNGRKRPVELRIRHSKAMKQRVADGKHNFWKGGISEVNRKFKANFQSTVEYKLWRTAVFERDGYKCIWCGSDKSGTLNADHILEFATHPELRLAIDNGRTLCRQCHYKRHSKQ